MQSSFSLVLASGSPRRQELLQQLGYSFSICVPNIEESQLSNEDAMQYVTRLAQQKAQAGLKLVTSQLATADRSGANGNISRDNIASDNILVLGADTIVVCDNQVLEKPQNKTDAARMLNMLSGRTHQVMTAVSVVNNSIIKSGVIKNDVINNNMIANTDAQINKQQTDSKIKQQTQVVTTNVSFKVLTADDIEQYWLTGEPCDKAGGYGIQGIGGRFVTHLDGSYHAVVGLPMYETDELLRAFL